MPPVSTGTSHLSPPRRAAGISRDLPTGGRMGSRAAGCPPQTAYMKNLFTAVMMVEDVKKALKKLPSCSKVSVPSKKSTKLVI